MSASRMSDKEIVLAFLALGLLLILACVRVGVLHDERDSWRAVWCLERLDGATVSQRLALFREVPECAEGPRPEGSAP